MMFVVSFTMSSKNTTSVLVSLPVDLVADVDLNLFDPIRGKIKYGARSRLIAELLRRWLRDSSDEEQPDPPPCAEVGDRCSEGARGVIPPIPSEFRNKEAINETRES